MGLDKKAYVNRFGESPGAGKPDLDCRNQRLRSNPLLGGILSSIDLSPTIGLSHENLET